MRDLLAALRKDGEAPAGLGGPAPMTAKDRSRFAGKLDEQVTEQVTAARRAHPPGPEAQGWARGRTGEPMPRSILEAKEVNFPGCAAESRAPSTPPSISPETRREHPLHARSC